MSTLYNNGSYFQNHQRAVELHEAAAHAHLSAAETLEKQDHQTGHELTRQALEDSEKAFHQTGLLQHSGDVNEHGVAMFHHDDVAALAYHFWQDRGCPEGSAEEDWLRAARELRDRAISLQTK